MSLEDLRSKIDYLEQCIKALDIKRAQYVKDLKVLREALEIGANVQSDVLTTRQREVLQCLLDGLPDKEIALKLHMSTHTVKKHCGNIYSKMGIRGRNDLIKKGGVYGP